MSFRTSSIFQVLFFVLGGGESAPLLHPHPPRTPPSLRGGADAPTKQSPSALHRSPLCPFSVPIPSLRGSGATEAISYVPPRHCERSVSGAKQSPTSPRTLSSLRAERSNLLRPRRGAQAKQSHPPQQRRAPSRKAAPRQEGGAP